MACLSVRSRYGGSRYMCEWTDRAKWLALVKRFHGVSYVRCFFKDEIMFVETVADMGDGGGRVQMMVKGNAFWGCMPRGPINWDALPADPSPEVPESVKKYASSVCHAADMVGFGGDLALSFEVDTPIDPSWFPYVVRAVLAERPVRSLFYAPSTHTMWLYVLKPADRTGVGQVAFDGMIVRFDGVDIDYAADPSCDLDEGIFGSDVPQEMKDDWAKWRDDTNMDPEADVLALRAPYDRLPEPFFFSDAAYKVIIPTLATGAGLVIASSGPVDVPTLKREREETKEDDESDKKRPRVE